MKTSRNTITNTTKKVTGTNGRPPLAPPPRSSIDVAGGGAQQRAREDAESRRARRSEVLAEVNQKQAGLALTRNKRGHSPSSSTTNDSLSIRPHRKCKKQRLPSSSLSGTRVGSGSESTVLTSKQTAGTPEQVLNSTDDVSSTADRNDGVQFMSPAAFQAYRDAKGYIGRLPVGEVCVDPSKSPGSTLGSTMSRAPHVQLFSNNTNTPKESEEDQPPNVAGASSTESALLDLFDTTNQTASGKKSSSKKKKKKVAQQPTATVLRELRRVAAYDAQSFVFTQLEKTGKEGTHDAIAEQFYGTNNKPRHRPDDDVVKGTLAQMLSGDGAYKALYDAGDVIGETKELILKKEFCGPDTASRFVAGEHFTSKLVSEAGNQNGRKATGRQLWDQAKLVTLHLKKAMALVKKLDNIIVQLDDTSNRVIDYMSGKNDESFFTAVLNGMYHLHQLNKEKKKKKKEAAAALAGERNIFVCLMYYHINIIDINGIIYVVFFVYRRQ